MCTFNIALDDKLVNVAKSSFANHQSMTAWMEEQISVLLLQYVSSGAEKHERQTRKHDALMGVISNMANVDCKQVHLKEKYGI